MNEILQTNNPNYKKVPINVVNEYKTLFVRSKSYRRWLYIFLFYCLLVSIVCDEIVLCYSNKLNYNER